MHAVLKQSRVLCFVEEVYFVKLWCVNVKIRGSAEMEVLFWTIYLTV